jgi:hypothetical protein
MSKFEILSLLVSTLAAVIACISLVRARKLAKEQLELARVTADLSRLQIESIAEKKSNKIKPKFNVNLTKLGKFYNFYISNTGEGSAYNVDFKLIDCENSPLSDYELQDLFPHQEMKSNSRIKLMASMHMNSPRKYQVKLVWENQAGEKSEEIFWPTR